MTDRRQFSLNVMTLWVGILIPILAALIPFGISKLTPEQELVFQITGPIAANRLEALEVTLTNSGSKPTKGVKVYIKSFPQYSLPEILQSKGSRKSEPTERIEVSSKNPVKVSMSGEYFVLDVGDLRAKEKLSIAIASREKAFSVYGSGTHMTGIEVKSDELVGTPIAPSDWQEFWYPFGFWMFVAMMVLIFSIAVYQQYLMDPKEREKLILKEIDKLPK